MRRRTFLASATAAVCPMVLGTRARTAPVRSDDARTFATPADARKSPPETLAYVAAVSCTPGKPG